MATKKKERTGGRGVAGKGSKLQRLVRSKVQARGKRAKPAGGRKASQGAGKFSIDVRIVRSATGPSRAEVLVDGRSAFTAPAKKIIVNQDPRKGQIEDRRHMAHLKEMIVPWSVEIFVGLYAKFGCNESQVLRALKKPLGADCGATDCASTMKWVLTQLNSVPGNLVGDDADTNKALEIARAQVRKLRRLLAEPFNKDAGGMPVNWTSMLKQCLPTGAPGATGIAGARNRIAEELRGILSKWGNACHLNQVLTFIEDSLTFDLSAKATREQTAACLDWVKKMHAQEHMDSEARYATLWQLQSVANPHLQGAADADDEPTIPIPGVGGNPDMSDDEPPDASGGSSNSSIAAWRH